jgi:hypothetical protein
MPRYRKKPVEIEAARWTGNENDLEDVLVLVDWQALPTDDVHVKAGIGYVPAHGTLDIPTLEGVMTAQPGDWIVKGVQGELYPVKPDIFEATYEPAEMDCEPLLGCATTTQLLAELQARAEIGGYANYRTIDA